MPATQTRADLRSSFRRFHARHHQRTPIRPNARRPIHSGVRRSQEEFSVRAIERVEIAIAIGLHNRLHCLPFDVEIDQHRIGHGVPIVRVMWRELEMPLELARVGIDRHQAARVQIVAGAHVAIHARPGVARAPIDQVQIGIVGSGDPCGPAAALPRVARPGISARLAFGRNGVKAPGAFTRLRIVGVNEATNTVFAAGDAENDEIFHGERREREAVAFAVVHGRDVPDDVAGFRVQSNHMRVERAKENFVAKNRQAAIDAPAAGANVRRERALVLPNGPAGARVEREGAVVLAGSVENAIHDERRGFEFSAGHRLIRPLRDERARIGRVDLIQRAEAAAGVVAGIHEPVLRLFRGVEQSLRRDLRARRRGKEARS